MVGASLRAAQGAPLIELRRCASPDDLLALAGDFLAAREAEHNLIFGILGSIRRDPDTYGEGEPYLAVIEKRGATVGVVVRTPPFGPVLSQLEELGVVDVIADDLARVTDDLAGVLGPREAAARFADRWSALTGAVARRIIEERIYSSESATRPTRVEGASRTFAPSDRELVLSWLDAFAGEALPDEAPRHDSAGWLERRLADPEGDVLLWESRGAAVSLAASGQATPNGLRVGPVYTPPEHRRRGYGAAVTAAVTARALARGRRFCFLFTDLANPTSNAIYQRIGYRPVCDVDQWSFDR